MNVDIEQVLPEFIAESRTLLQELETALLRLEHEGADADTVNAMFRAAHTIKGSAGVFGLDPIVKFTHVMENVLDQLREEKITLTADLVNVLLACCDHLSALIDALEQHKELSDPDKDARAQQLTTRLRAHLDTPEATANLPVEQPVSVEARRNYNGEFDHWHLSVRFGRNVLRHGMDPLSFIRYLGTLGEVAHVTTLLNELPDADHMDPESCYLGFEIALRTGADKQTIENAFEFVRDDCVLRILPPPNDLSRYLERINNLSGDTDRLGEMLRESGILTEGELDVALKFQGSVPETESQNKAPPLGEILIQQGAAQKPVVDAALDKQKKIREHKAQEARFVRVHADKLDALINLVGELVIASASISLLALKSGNTRLHESSNTMGRLVEEIRDGALHLRMVEIGDTFNRFPRVVRDVSKELGKDIELIISGADTALDKTVVEKIGDPLMHLVRNAMDHGIEAAEVRTARGKPAKGTLRLNAFHDSGSVVIEVGDDGGGLPRDKILQKAVERGLATEGQRLTDTEIYNLIFEPGFSTAEAVTNLSGRGVGMDVVRRNIQALRGTVEIHSEAQQGTIVRIRLPLTLAIIDGFLVGVAASCYVVPLDMVVECIELSPQHVQDTGDHNYVNLRGEVLPFIRLHEQFALKGAAKRRASIVVVQHAGHKAGLVVDELLGEFQTVIKPLASLFNRVQGVSGSTILGTGEVALILDIPALIHQAAAAHDQQERKQRVA